MAKLKKKQQEALDHNSKYLNNLGESIGYHLVCESTIAIKDRLRVWAIYVYDIDCLLQYSAPSHDYTNLIDDILMQRLVNYPMSNPLVGTDKEGEEDFKTSFNNYLSVKKLATSLDTALTKKAEQARPRKLKI